jgi:acetyl-CoA hydrolase
MIDSIDFRDWLRPGDMVAWGQASGEPLSLTAALMAQRHAVGPFKVFNGLCYSDTADPRFADTVEFFSYHGGASNRRLVDAGRLNILPCHYSQLADILRPQVTVLLLHLSPPDAQGDCSLGFSH